MAANDDQVDNNWMKAALALLYTKEGIEQFVDTEVKQFHQRILDTFRNQNLPDCSQCSTNDVQDASWCCPNNGFCSKIRDHIVNFHINKGPSWKNTDATLWHSNTNSWEIAKCFITTTGYKDVPTAADTDFSGIVNVVINHIYFQQKVDNKLFKVARTARNDILHSHNLKLTEAEMNRYFGILIQLLQDPKHLAGNNEAQQAVIKLQKLQNGLLAVTPMDKIKMINDALRAIETKKLEVLDSLETQHVANEATLNSMLQAALHTLQSEKDTAITQLHLSSSAIKIDIDQHIQDTSNTAMKDLEDKASKLYHDTSQQLKDHFQKLKNKTSQEITKQSELTTAVLARHEEHAKADIAHHVERAKADIAQQEHNAKAALLETGKDQMQVILESRLDAQGAQTNIQSDISEHNALLKYLEDKQGLQSRLITLYEERCSLIQIHPLIQDDGVPIEDLYAKPYMKQVNGDNEDTVTSYNDIFYKDSSLCKNIYITGDAGTGKSTLCQRIVSTWCHARLKIQKGVALSTDEECLAKFSFLFLIILRDTMHEVDIVDMIKNDELLNMLSVNDRRILSEVLDKEPELCLTVLDGLDEWVSPNTRKKSRFMTAGLPGRRALGNSTVLTTSRPWKLEVLGLLVTDYDKLIKLKGIDDQSSYRLIKSVVTILNTKHKRNKDALTFKHELKKKNLWQFRAIPVMLIQLIVLWHDEKPLGESQCDIYSAMIELLIHIAQERLTDEQLGALSNQSIRSQVQLPTCFNGKTKCQNFKSLLYSLGRLSFETLFNTDRERALVFERSVTQPCGISKEEVEICLKIGILSQSKTILEASAQHKTLSFLHKTFQEYLASVFVSMSCDNNLIKTIFNFCHSLETILEMSKVFMFVSGMSEECACQLSDDIYRIINLSEDTMKYRESVENTFSDRHILNRVQEMFVECLDEGANNGNNVTMQLDDIFISKEIMSPHLVHLLRTNIPNIKSIYIRVELLQNIQEHVMQLSSLQKLECISSVRDKDLYTLVLNSKNTLKCLYLASSRMNHSQIVSVMSILSQATHMKAICLKSLKCKECTPIECQYQLDLSRHHQLRELNLNKLTVSAVQFTASHIRVFSIGELKPTLMTELLNCLRDAPKLQILRCNSQPDINALTAIVPTLRQLRDIYLWNIDFGYQYLQLSPHMQYIMKVNLENVTMTSDALCRCIDSIPYTKQSVKVEFNRAQISREVATTVENYIKSYPRFSLTKFCENLVFFFKDGYDIHFHTR